VSAARYWSSYRHEVTVLLLVLAALLYVPVPLGSNRPYAWLGLNIYIFAVFAFWVSRGIFSADHVKPGALPKTLVALLAVWLTFIYLQTVELPGSVVAALNPLAYSLQQNLKLINIEPSHTLSIDPGSSQGEFLKYLGYIAITTLLLVTVTTRSRLLWAAAVVILAGILEAVFGVYSYATDFVIFPETDAGNEVRAGTYVNRNHFSNFLTMVLGLVIGLLTAVINSRKLDSPSNHEGHSDVTTALTVLLSGLALILIAAIFVSGSRGAVVFFVLAFGLMLILAWPARHKSKAEFILAPAVVLGVVTVLVLGFDKSIVRLLEKDVFGGERMLQYVLSLKLLSSTWLTGVGAGNYQWAFTMFRNNDLRFVTYDHAHNDYLEVAAEQGLLGSLLLGAVVCWIMWTLYTGYRSRRNPLMRGVIFGCLLSVIYMLMHSAVEFNFRIPANAVYFFAISALGIAACRIDRQKRKSSSSRGRPRESVDD